MLLLESGTLDMTAPRDRRENPFACGAGLPHVQNRQQTRRSRNAPPRCPALALEDLNGPVSDVLPLELATFLRPQPAIEQHRYYVAKQERFNGLYGLLSSHRRPDALQRCVIRPDDSFADGNRRFQITTLLFRRKNSLALVLSLASSAPSAG